ncbi:hypothetical protein STFE110948_03945 [Streptobacillus felis]|uniref:hypothetical protein n=1 Tax=Streptobacillus felis TaxID=1384509 RepID=UPI00082B7DC8|nr:hypothetical protein [Streptobacillus felis]
MKKLMVIPMLLLAMNGFANSTEMMMEKTMNLLNMEDNMNTSVKATIKGDKVFLNIDDKKYELDRIRSGSGEMFTYGKVNLGIKGNEAYIEIDNKISNYEVEGQDTKDYAKSIKY